MHSIHQFKVKSIDKGVIDFADFKGKKILIVNVASECGFTPQYQQLQELFEVNRDQLVIIGFPSNDFGGQEPGNNASIQAFCQSKYGISFPLAAKVNILGPTIHPVYKWLTQKSKNGVLDAEVRWNFTKFLLDETGQVFACYPSSISPFDDKILDWLML